MLSDRPTDTQTTNGLTTTAHYDAVARTVTRTSAAGGQTVTRYTDTGLVEQFQGGDYHPSSYSYDGRGRLTSATTGTGTEARTTSYSYGADGLVSTITDPLHSLSYTRDAVGRVLTSRENDDAETGFSYDANGNLTGLTPPGRAEHGFGYSDADLGSRYSSPAIADVPTDTTSQYNRDRQPTLTTLPSGRSVGASYDTSGRLVKTTLAAGDFSYRYHPTTGLLTGVTTPAGDSLDTTLEGALPTAITAGGAAPGTVGYGYDSALRLSSRTITGGPTTSFGYNNDGQLTTAGPMSLAYHAANGYLTGTTAGSVSTSTTRDGFAEPTARTASTTANGGSTLYDAGYTYDKLGRIVTRTETVGGSASTYGYTYDSRNRLETVSKDGVLQARYEYDSNGNRTSSTVNGVVTAATVDAQDRLAMHGDTSYTYTADGHLDTATTAGAVTDYNYNELGQLVRAQLPDGTTVDYRYDGSGRRITKAVDGTITQRYLYGEGRRPVAEVDAAGTITATYTYATSGHLPDLITKGDVTYRIVSDHQSNPRLIVNTATGAVAQRMDFDSWGNVLQDTNPGFQPFGYTGGLHDAHTGLVYLDARDYDPAVGRFTSKDPIGFSGGDTNLYVYVGNDPVNAIDPSGLLRVFGQDIGVDQLAQGVMGLGDELTFGAKYVRQKLGLDHVVDYCSGWYNGGGIAGAINPKGLVKAGVKQAARAVPEIKSGIYIVNTPNGVYVGQSGNITKRLQQHVRAGKFTPQDVANAARQDVAGGKTQREIAEQMMIDRLGGKDNLLNEVNPIGPKRFGIMPNQPYGR